MTKKLLLWAVFALPVLAIAKLDTQLVKDESGQSLMVQDTQQKGLPPAQLGISPAKIDGILKQSAKSFRLDKSVTFYNYTSKPKGLKLTLIDTKNTQLKDWTLINPRTITIPPKGQQTIRLSFRPPKTLPTQKYEATLFIEQQITDPLTYDEDGKGVTMQIGSRYGLPIALEIMP